MRWPWVKHTSYIVARSLKQGSDLLQYIVALQICILTAKVRKI